MTKRDDILIVGGGLNGPTLALALAQQGHSVTLIDALPHETRQTADFDGRAYALSLSSMRLLRAIGVWGTVAGNAQPMLEIKVSDGRAGEGPAPFFLHFDHGEIEEGPMGYMCEDRYLRRALLDAVARTAAITQITDQVIAQEVVRDGATITLRSGEVLTGSLLVGCDGRASGTATRAGIRRTGWGYRQTALVAAIGHDLPHDGIAHQFFMPQGPLAILPLPGNKSSIVWSEAEATAKSFTALDDDRFMDILRPRFGDFLGDIRLCGQRFSYPLTLSLANQITAPRLALVGDAAHGVHPLAGQGLNAGFKDVAALVHVMSEARQRGEDVTSPQVLERYAAWRRFDNTSMAMVTDATNRLFSNDNPLLRLGRDLGMGIINSIPSVRRAMIREAAGLTGELPDLMKP